MFKPVLPLVVVAALLGSSAARADDSQPAPAPTPPPVAPPTVTPSGQWVDTSQYGTVWLPYDQQYTYVTPDSSVAYMYAYYPTFGWGWIGAPWVLGIGPGPHWGVYGAAHFAWYAHPWFRAGIGHRGPVGHPFAGHPFRGGGGGHGRR